MESNSLIDISCHSGMTPTQSGDTKNWSQLCQSWSQLSLSISERRYLCIIMINTIKTQRAKLAIQCV